MPRQSRDRPWVVIFILLSLLAHLLFVVAIVLVGHFFPPPKLKNDVDLSPVTVSLEQTPPEQPPPEPPPHKIFMPTSPDAEAKAKEEPIESDNDTLLRTKSHTARDDTSIMPDVTAKMDHADLRKEPNEPSKEPPHPAAASANGRDQQQQKSAQQTPQPSPQPQPQPSPSRTQQPSPSVAKQPSPTPEKVPAPKVAQQALDPNGLPVLPMINAPTMAPASQHEEAAPAASIPQVEADVHGAVGMNGDTSPAAMATELGRYKAKVWRTVGSYWYPKVDKQFQVIPVGLVRIHFTIHSDGTVDTKVLEGNEGSLQILLAISLNSIRDSAPFDRFSDAMIREVGDSYSDDFTFSIYGGGQ